jgi:hypothetical protein
MSAPIAILRSNFTCDFRAGRIADDATRDEADRAKDDCSSKAAESCVGYPFVSAGRDRRQEKTGCNDNTTYKSFHLFVPRVYPFQSEPPREVYSTFPDSHFDEKTISAIAGRPRPI